ncbi:DNA polymerase III subunit chi [Pseudomonas syringae]|uniref:DNA polymerase III subunit chi n=1 Tax=Pseudomonas syringae TaxID=317 RepID=A0A9Q4A409_PSESX|nr:DNA polymerase III subunit chi [Pseudomonas syringae]MCF5470863.1 DNA polymerase III subunit chi [Pseudomonas syringae]MCF5473614.1 DNA polymerase III subunit chi [Pseudomonas syringae]MCF5485959.1 DNA polymerase III subunit chi [Pseudomonas syringae]MCF5488264.1 DNA polymerase III subunit chi [Pseudomonas syringae]MCF5492427.1 DNA polymerase III subunit chi [Pseudomonas syringae]
MDTSKKAESAHLLDDLESIRQLLGDDATHSPLLTDTVHREGQIPLLFDMVGNRPASTHPEDVDEDDIPTLTPDVQAMPVAQLQQAPQAQTQPNPDALLHLDSELRAAAQLIMQDVIDDFAPHIETEIKRRLEARMERLIAAAKGS